MRDFTGVSGADGGLAKSTPDPATRWTPEVANAIVQELKKVITDPDGGNAALDGANNHQLFDAITLMITTAIGATASRKKGTYGYTVSVPYTYTVYFDAPFPDGTNYVLSLDGHNSSGSAARDNWPQWVSKTEAGFTVVIQGSVTGGDNTLDGFDWVADPL